MKRKRSRGNRSDQLGAEPQVSATDPRRIDEQRRSAQDAPADVPDAGVALPLKADEAQQWLAALVDSSNDAILSKTLDGIVTSWNAAAQRIYGYTAEEIVGTSIDRIIPPDRSEEFAQIMHDVQQGRRIDYFETVRVRKDGARIDVSITVSPIKDASGRIVGASTIGRDVTERRRMRAELHASEERFRALANAAPTMVWTAAPDGTITFANQQWFNYCGITPEQNPRDWPELVLHPDDRERCVFEWMRAIERGTDYEIEVRNRRYDGEYRWFLTRAVPARDADGQIIAWYGTTTDIHERKLVEEERAQLLEREQRARAEAQEAVRMRDVFLSVASHELKTPLTSLLGNAQLLQRRARREVTFSARNQQALDVIVEQARRLAKMIAAMLDLSRIEMGQLSIEHESIDICALVRRVVAEVQPALEQHRVEYGGADAPLLVAGDELRLEQALQNLVQNAIKYSPNGGLVSVRVEQHGDRVQVAVTDQGIGIPAQAMPRLFERLYRASNVDERQISGMGIGLYVVREIVALHGGTVEVQSEEGRGSTFAFWLPLADRLAIQGNV